MIPPELTEALKAAEAAEAAARAARDAAAEARRAAYAAADAAYAEKVAAWHAAGAAHRAAQAACDEHLPRCTMIDRYGGPRLDVAIVRRTPTSIWVRHAGGPTRRFVWSGRRGWTEYGGRCDPAYLVEVPPRDPS